MQLFSAVLLIAAAVFAGVWMWSLKHTGIGENWLKTSRRLDWLELAVSGMVLCSALCYGFGFLLSVFFAGLSLGILLLISALTR